MKKSNKQLLEYLNLPIIESLEEMSDLLGLSSRILYLISKDNSKFYYKFTIPKKDGSRREIVAPILELKLLQRWILNNILYKIPISNQAMAFRRGNNYNIKGNAEMHKFNLYYLEMDLENFFNTIPKVRVINVFRSFGYNGSISNWFANVCTYNDYLPQGAITSPHISNIICKSLDKRLEGFSSKREITYTRYADDMTFSGDNKEILRRSRAVIEDIIRSEGFSVNKNKTRYLAPNSHKRITGVTIYNSKLKASKQIKQKVRSMIHRAIITKDYSNLNQIKGYIAYIDYIEDGYREKIIRYMDNFQNKDVVYFQDLVVAYNSNKLYKECKDLIYKEEQICDNYSLLEQEEFYLATILQEREEFISRIKK